MHAESGAPSRNDLPPHLHTEVTRLRERLQLLQEQTATRELVCVAVHNGEDFRIIYASDTVTRTLPHSAAPLVGRLVSELKHPVAPPGLWEQLRKVWQPTASLQPAANPQSPATVHSSHPCRVNHLSDGSLQVLYTADTEQRGLHRAKSPAGDRLQQVFDATPIAFVITDLVGQITYASPRASALLCEPRDRLLGCIFGPDLLQLSLPDGNALPKTHHPLAQVQRLGQTTPGNVYRHKDRTGSWHHLRVSGAPVVDSTGSLAELVFTLDDITDAQRRQAELERVERNLSQAQRLGEVGSWEVQPGLDGQWWSNEMFRLHGLDARRDRPDVNRLLQQIFPADRSTYLQFLDRLRSRPGRYACEYRVHSQLGSTRTLRAFGHHESAPGGRVSGHIVGFCQNVTDQRAADEAQQSARLAAESANQEQSRFLVVMSHELRTSLNNVRGFAELLRNTVTAPLSQSYARYIVQSADDLTTIIGDILDISSIEAGDFRLDSAPLSPTEIVTDVTRAFRARATEQQTRIVADVARAVPPMVCGDPQRLRQILRTLVANAVRLTEQGVVTLRVEPTVQAHAPALCWTVDDTGVGIPEDRLPHIFDVLTNADIEPQRSGTGFGLGLSVSKRLVELMGGTITAESTVGRGSSFRVTLPYEHTASVQPIPPGGPASRFAPLAVADAGVRKRILVVEDDSTNMALIVAVLQTLPLEVTLSSSGSKALELAESGSFDAILMDVQLPGLCGCVCVRE